MTKAEIRYAAVLGCLFAGLILFEIYKPKPIDWSTTLSNKDKIPYGTHVVYATLDTLFPGREIIESRLPAYNFLNADTARRANYVAIADNLAFDSNDTRSLLRFAAAGNSVFLAAQYMHLPELLDALHIGVNDTLTIALRDSLKISTSLVNPRLGGNRYQFQRTFQNTSFFEFDSLTSAAAVLGRNSLNTPDFIRVGFGQGAFYLHLQPLAFSNYYVLNDTTTDYAFKALSYLPPDRDIIWDEYIHQGRVGDHSIMRVVMSKPALQWAYYTAIFGILLFVIFEGKRRQRIIPAIQPLQNTTLEFVNIVSRLYFQKQDHHGIAHKKTLFFLEHIRTQYHLPTNRLDENFAETLSHKSGYPLEKTKYLVWKIGQVTTTNSITADGLLKLNNDIEHFYATTARDL